MANSHPERSKRVILREVRGGGASNISKDVDSMIIVWLWSQIQWYFCRFHFIFYFFLQAIKLHDNRYKSELLVWGIFQTCFLIFINFINKKRISRKRYRFLNVFLVLTLNCKNDCSEMLTVNSIHPLFPLVKQQQNCQLTTWDETLCDLLNVQKYLLTRRKSTFWI